MTLPPILRRWEVLLLTMLVVIAGFNIANSPFFS